MSLVSFDSHSYTQTLTLDNWIPSKLQDETRRREEKNVQLHRENTWKMLDEISFLFVCFKASPVVSAFDLQQLCSLLLRYKKKFSTLSRQMFREISLNCVPLSSLVTVHGAAIGVRKSPKMSEDSRHLIFLYSFHQLDSPLRAHESMDCTLTRRRDAPSSFCRRMPMWHRRNPRHHEDSQMRMLCCSDNYSISDKNAECPPSCWCECCCCFPEMTKMREELVKVLDYITCIDDERKRRELLFIFALTKSIKII